MTEIETGIMVVIEVMGTGQDQKVARGEVIMTVTEIGIGDGLDLGQGRDVIETVTGTEKIVIGRGIGPETVIGMGSVLVLRQGEDPDRLAGTNILAGAEVGATALGGGVMRVEIAAL